MASEFSTSVPLSHLGRNFSLKCHPNDYLTKVIQETGSFYEVAVLETLRRNFPRQGTIIDIGANVGNHALFFANFFESSRLICFEPFAPSYDLLRQNLAGRAEFHPVALGDRAGTCSLQVFPGNLGMCDVIEGQPGAIEMRTLDSYEFENVTLLKIDVENFYLKTFAGAMSTIRRCHPIIIAEADFYQVFPFLQAEGYVCAGYWHFDSHNILFIRLARAV